MKRARILLADDHTIILEAFKKLIEPEFEVVGTVADGRALLKAAEELRPDLVMLDVSMPVLNGLEAGRRLKKMLPAVKLVYLTMNQDRDVAAEAVRAGAAGFLLKNSAASELLTALRACLRGGSYITPLVAEDVIDVLMDAGGRSKEPISLTPRQREVLQLLAEGRSMKEVAFLLDVTPRTVAFHKYGLMEHLHIRTNAELVQFAIRHRIVFA
ncbi:MAG: response regulator [Pyrinomonadaceae bacterium]